MVGYFKDFTTAYKIALLWTSTDDNGAFLDFNFSIHDLSQDTCLLIEEACISFITGALRHGIDLLENVTLAEQAGHDFWLTHNHHGAGFWDRPEVYGKPAADTLTKLSESFGEQTAYVSDKGQIELE